MYVEKKQILILKQLPTPKFVFRRSFYQKRKCHNKSLLLCVLKTSNIHLSAHLCGRGVHSLPLNSLLDHISHALSVTTGRIPLFCDIIVYFISSFAYYLSLWIFQSVCGLWAALSFTTQAVCQLHLRWSSTFTAITWQPLLLTQSNFSCYLYIFCNLCYFCVARHRG